MQTSSKFMDDMSRLMVNAMGAVPGAREEAETAMRSLIDWWLADRDLVTPRGVRRGSRHGPEALENNEALRARIEELEKSGG